MGFEWYALVCILVVIVGGVLAYVLAGPVLARIFFGREPGGRK